MGELVNFAEYRAACKAEKDQKVEDEIEALRNILSEIIAGLPPEPAMTSYVPPESHAAPSFMLPQTNLDGYET
jgi:hypothetical protein